MAAVETTLALVILAIALGLVARQLRIPYPIALVLGGLVLGFIHTLPNLEFDPELVFFFFLPPLLYHAAVFTSWRDFRANLGPISLLAIGLVIATTAAVAVVAHMFVPELPWAAAFALGAIVSPPDAICATAAMANSRVPRRLVTVIEGESLVNDAAGLIIYKYAVAAAVTGTFSAADAGLDFLFVGFGGIAIGAALGLLFLRLHRKLADPMIEVTVSLAIPFAVYLAAEKLGTSGVLAVVTAGLIRGWYAPEVLSPQSRIRGFAAWDVVVFILNGLVFILIGSELDEVWDALPGFTFGRLLRHAAAVAAAVIAVRFLWIFASAYLQKLAALWMKTKPLFNWRENVVLGWAGMRGVVSLAAALAIPLTTASGQPFPGRELIAFLTFSVIFATLVIQGMTMAPLARWLKVKADDTPAREERLARQKTMHAALAEIDKLAGEGFAAAGILDSVRLQIARQMEEIEAADPDSAADGIPPDSGALSRRDVLRAAIRAQRRELLRLRYDSVIGDDVMHRIERDLDLQDSMLT